MTKLLMTIRALLEATVALRHAAPSKPLCKQVEYYSGRRAGGAKEVHNKPPRQSPSFLLRPRGRAGLPCPVRT